MQTESWPEYLARKKAQAAEERRAAAVQADEGKPKRGRRSAGEGDGGE